MKNELDSKMILRVFDKLRQHGQNKDGTYILDGLKAFTDFDGYTVFIEDATVKLSYGFHNQYHYEYEDSAQREAFEKKLKHVDEHY